MHPQVSELESQLAAAHEEPETGSRLCARRQGATGRGSEGELEKTGESVKTERETQRLQALLVAQEAMKRGWERERREWEKILEKENEAREIERRALQSAVAEGKREANERERESEVQERKAQREWEAEREREREEERERARDREEQHAEALAEARREFDRELKERERQVAAWADRYHALEAHVFATSSDAEVHKKVIAGAGIGAVEARHLNGSREQCEDGTVEAVSEAEGGPGGGGGVLYSEGGDRGSEADGELSCTSSCAQCDLLKSASDSLRARWAPCVSLFMCRESRKEREEG
jgi:hypothetical protein